ncbi:chemotaxis response regulator CheB [Clostridium beijerinckii]|nr:chemotaxis response regulator CheB [Clostridium beijerinckii]NRY68988.1 chemotaxis response regulator CheB [Clostridium beijerinckii]
MKKVLIVDDAVYMRLSLREILERNGFEVIGDAENGIEAIDKYKMLSPDIVTMDITMPEMDGIQALEEIKK